MLFSALDLGEIPNSCKKASCEAWAVSWRDDGLSYLLLGFMSSTFRSKLCAGRIVDGGKAALWIIDVSSGERDLAGGTIALRRLSDGGRCASSWDMGGIAC